jgi:hypothetical protein
VRVFPVDVVYDDGLHRCANRSFNVVNWVVLWSVDKSQHVEADAALELDPCVRNTFGHCFLLNLRTYRVRRLFRKLPLFIKLLLLRIARFQWRLGVYFILISEDSADLITYHLTVVNPLYSGTTFSTPTLDCWSGAICMLYLELLCRVNCRWLDKSQVSLGSEILW